ncbi:hypothetical protein PIN31115_02075 [Pandoraea iniqua]|uniref:Terminase small subunit protein n=1 Tax=Pandoraea iniqua TaxID=2508288 RepID=A0A5E4UKL6_9BURK|nr:ubiquitin carboxyl-hydrolase [Pandoraea iniqua]VVE00432.1 hypothetical protein PIN31115_02075 [Pandoraea iniqua]
MAGVTFSQALFDRICERMAEGESLRVICKSKDMPNKRTVMRWVAADEKLAEQYSEAQSMRADCYFDQIIDIADSKADPQKTRVQIDARKWVLARMNPKKYGDKFTQELTGSEGGALIVKIVREGEDDA